MLDPNTAITLLRSQEIVNKRTVVQSQGGSVLEKYKNIDYRFYKLKGQ